MMLSHLVIVTVVKKQTTFVLRARRCNAGPFERRVVRVPLLDCLEL
jgi:hypothetical protein